MAKLICISDGHGPQTPGKRTPPIDGKIIHENQFNAPAATFLEISLKRCGFRTLQAAPESADISLAARVERANTAKADAFIDIHYNAFRGVWDQTLGGSQTCYQPGNVQGQKLAGCVQKYIALGTPQINRGIVPLDLYVTRNFKGPGIVVENGFMDVREEAARMLNEAFQKEQAEQMAQGICEYFGVKYIPEMPPRDELAEAIGVLVRAGLINSPEYWLKNAVSGGKVDGPNAAALIRAVAKKLK